MIILDSKDTVVIEKTKELCQTILEQDQFKALRKNIDDFMADNTAQEQYNNVIDKREYLAHLQEQGIELTDEQFQEFEVARDGLLANPVAKGYLDAQQELLKMQETISTHIGRTIELGRMPTEDDLQPQGGGCCGGQSESGGCCGGGG